MTLGTIGMSLEQTEQALGRLTAVHTRTVDATIRATMNLVYDEFMKGQWIGAGTWPNTYSTIVGNSQAQIAAQAAGFFAEYSSLSIGEAVPLAPQAQMAAWMVNPDTLSAQAMPKRYGRLSNQGASRVSALNRAGRYGSELSAGDLQFAQRAAGRDFGNWAQVPLKGWRKIPSGAPCGWCIVVSDQVYRTENVPFHQACRCGVAPAVEGDGWKPGTFTPQEQAEILADPSSFDAASIPPPPSNLPELSADLPDPFSV